MGTGKPRYAWVDYAKGICIFAVVSLYSANEAIATLGDAGWMQSWVNFARPFRMPDFFLLSGLFLARVIARPWAGYLDKKVIHYSYFFLLWSLINLIIQHMVGELHGGTRQFAVQYWSMISSWPFHMLWFIQMLPAYFLFTKLTRKIPFWVMIPIAALLHAFPVLHTNRMLIDEFWDRYIYFYIGYIFAPFFFKLAEYIQKNTVHAVVGVFSWIVINATLVHFGLSSLPFIGLALGLIGATGIITIGALAEKNRFAGWLRYLGQNSIVVYLAFYWPMILASHLIKSNAFLAVNPGLFACVITAFGLLGSLLLFWFVNWKWQDHWLFKRPKWATLNIRPTKIVEREIA